MNAWLFATIFFILPLIVLAAMVLVSELNVLVAVLLLTWVGIGLLFGPGTSTDGA